LEARHLADAGGGDRRIEPRAVKTAQNIAAPAADALKKVAA
jgi:hypothetical protein